VTYPIAEIFHSVQGEGFWTGTPMMFVRLAGCNVGKYDAGGETPVPQPLTEFQLFHSKKHSICTTFDGQLFLCDTDYHTTAKLTPQQIAAELAKEQHVCITGGEPLLHDLDPLIASIPDHVMIHIESSGTVPFKELKDPVHALWLTCCPKSVNGQVLVDDFLDFTDEVKLLVGPGFKEELMISFELACDNLYLQPINGVHEVWKENLNRCLDLLHTHPNWKLSAQLHKYLEVR